MNKRAQITLFIVVGLVILSLVIGVLVLKEKIIIADVGVVDIADVPVNLRPIYNFVADVVYDVAVDGLIVMGEQGGWVSLEDSSLSGQTFVKHPDPTNSEIISFYNNAVPYWYFMSSPNDCNLHSFCEFSSKGRPLLHSWADNPADRSSDDTSVEAQLDRYIEKHIKDKLYFGFTSLERAGYKIRGEGDAEIVTIIGEDDLSVSLNYAITVDSSDGKGKLGSFFVRVPLNLKEIFSLADEISNAEAEHNTFSYTFWNWISTYQRVAPELPPISYEDVGATPAPWVMNSVEEFLEDNIFSRFVPVLRLTKTQNYVENNVTLNQNDPLSLIQAGIVAGLGLPILTREYNMSVIFFYHPDWDIYLNIDPHDGQLIKVDTFGGNILDMFGFSVQRGKFFYDVSTPIWVMMRDENALNGDGYNFQFAFESNIRNNRPLTAGAITNIIDSQEETLFDDPDMWFSGNITIEVQDNFGNPVEGVSVRYSIGAGIAVMIGETVLNDEGKAVLVSPFPVVSGGVLVLSKEGYLGYSGILLDTAMNDEAYILVQA